MDRDSIDSCVIIALRKIGGSTNVASIWDRAISEGCHSPTWTPMPRDISASLQRLKRRGVVLNEGKGHGAFWMLNPDRR